MADDDAAARKARAESLHRQIDEMKKAQQADERSRDQADVPPKPETPAEFVHRKMRELDSDKKK